MELRFSARRVALVLLAVGAVLTVVFVMTLSGGTAAAKAKHHRHAHHAKQAQTTTSGGPTQSGSSTGADNEPQASEGEGTSGVDPDGPGGPDIGGDHQCPPACAPGEQP